MDRIKKSLILNIFIILIGNFYCSSDSDNQDADCHYRSETLFSENVYSIYIDPKYADFQNGSVKSIDEHALSIPPCAHDNIKDLTESVIEPAATELEKIRAIYVWITRNISYDTDAYFNSDIDPVTDAAEVFSEQKSVCAGYANLLVAMAEEASLEVNKIAGYAKGYSYDPETTIVEEGDINHNWNTVKVSDTWILLDSTWGAGGLKKKEFDRSYKEYFMKPPPELFAYTHRPEGDADQLLNTPLSLTDFLDAKYVSVIRHLITLGVPTENIVSYLKNDPAALLVDAYCDKDYMEQLIQVIEAPLQRNLNRNTSYSFALTGNLIGGDQGNVVVIYKDNAGNYEITHFPQENENNQFSINYSTPDAPGTLKVSARLEAKVETGYWPILTYDIE
jgi:hypothetical protein